MILKWQIKKIDKIENGFKLNNRLCELRTWSSMRKFHLRGKRSDAGRHVQLYSKMIPSGIRGYSNVTSFPEVLYPFPPQLELDYYFRLLLSPGI